MAAKLINGIIFFAISASLALSSKAENMTCQYVKDIQWDYFEATLTTCIINNQTINRKNFSLVSAERLEAITIRDDKEVEFLPVNASVSFPHLKLLQVTNCSLKSVSRLALRGLSGLIDLDLSQNEITRIEANSLDDLKVLERLNLAGNQIAVIDAHRMKYLTSLKILMLDHNIIRTMHKRAFNELKSLKKVSISNNLIQTFLLGLFNNNHELERISLNDNQLNYLNFRVFSNNSDLQEVDLRNNNCVDAVYNETSFDKMRIHLIKKCSDSCGPQAKSNIKKYAIYFYIALAVLSVILYKYLRKK